MATVAWTAIAYVGQMNLYTATLSTGDETVPLTFPSAESEVSVQAVGTIGGSTVTVQQSLDGTNYSSAEGQAGTALALTTIGVVKRVVSMAPYLKVAVSAGAASGLVINCMVARKVRP